MSLSLLDLAAVQSDIAEQVASLACLKISDIFGLASYREVHLLLLTKYNLRLELENIVFSKAQLLC